MQLNNKEKIANAALNLFSKKGYDAVGIREIISMCDIEKPTLYYYFGSKEGILQFIIDSKYPHFITLLQTAAAYQGDIVISLESVSRTFFRFAKSEPDYYQLILSLTFAPEESTSRKLIAPLLKEQFTLVESLFMQAAAQHGNMADRHTRYALSFLGMINTYITLFLNKNLPDLGDDLVYQSCHQFMHGIFS